MCIFSDERDPWDGAGTVLIKTVIKGGQGIVTSPETGLTASEFTSDDVEYRRSLQDRNHVFLQKGMAKNTQSGA